MTTALAVRQSLTPDTWEMITAVAPAFKNSRLFGVANEAQAMSIMAKGFELGLSITSAFEFITVIQDRPTLVPRGALALILNSDELAGLKIDDQVDSKGNPTACEVWMKRKDGFEYTARFTMEDAKRAGVIKKGGGWESYPANMLRWRATGFCADVVFPDVIGGMKRADELGADLTPEGEVIEGSWSETMSASSVSPTPTPASASVVEPVVEKTTKPNPTSYLNELVQHYGAEAIITANEGKIPSTLEECQSVEDKLRGKADESSTA